MKFYLFQRCSWEILLTHNLPRGTDICAVAEFQQKKSATGKMDNKETTYVEVDHEEMMCIYNLLVR